jgi:hypothetical protein
VRSSILATLLSVATVIFPTVLSAQRPYAWVMPQGEPEEALMHPFDVLLEHRQELALADGQVGRIESLSERLVEINEPLLAQIRDAEVLKPERADEIRQAEAARDRFFANAREAETQVREILGAQQRDQARALIGHDSWAYPPPPEESAAAGTAAEETILVVENHNYYDANVYIVSGPRRQRLGFVGGLRNETFEIPEAFVAAPSGIRFEVRQIPQLRLPLTDEVTVLPGNLVYLRIPPS